MNVAILGGGASGLAAACACVSAGADVTVLEYGEKVGQKLLRTGNGRCNLSNINLDVSHYHGDTKFIKKVLSRFGANECEAMFSRIGIPFYTDREGRIYPRSEQAASVVTMLRAYASKGKYKEICSFHTERIEKTDKGFLIVGNGQKLIFDKLIVATGSVASASDFGGYEILCRFGHTLTPIFPSLNAVKIDKFSGLKGVRVGGKVILYADGESVASRQGEIQLGDETLSGICVFDLSRPIGEYFTLGTIDGKKCKNIWISIDFAPEYTENDVKTILFDRRQSLGELPLSEFLTGFINSRLARHLIGIATKKPFDAQIKTLGSGEIMTVVRAIKNLSVTPTALMPMSQAQVAAGGVKCDEFDETTFESRLVKGLYAVGEVLNCDGDCGGYNLHFAWASGSIAGESASR